MYVLVQVNNKKKGYNLVEQIVSANDIALTSYMVC